MWEQIEECSVQRVAVGVCARIHDHLQGMHLQGVLLKDCGQARTQGFEKGGYIVKKFPLNFWHFNVKLFFSHDSAQE